MSNQTYYKDHWVAIEEDRLNRYEDMFKWTPATELLLEPAAVEEGHVVADVGCGPGFVAVELAKRVGPAGHVHAFDINADFVARTQARAAREGLSSRLTAHQLTGAELPLADDALDRLINKNVMVYVDDPAESFQEFHRAVKPGGLVHVVDSDFFMTVVDPIPADRWRALLDAAIHAFRTPSIGRQLFGLATRTGFSEVDVQIVANPDTHGRMLHFVNNVAGYARDGGDLDEAEIQAIVQIATDALTKGRFFALNPQFMVTSRV
ncbi:MAG: ubiquinone/menaquinone biosynthesis C-methylase UbiE [Alphaproteobacteria bacterium]|jgi:ubiquinone/menaquinone biosynthesis C-methylase UbiE